MGEFGFFWKVKGGYQVEIRDSHDASSSKVITSIKVDSKKQAREWVKTARPQAVVWNA